MSDEWESGELVILKRSSQCRVTSPELRELRTLDEIKQLFQQDGMISSHADLPDVDLSSQAVMLLAMGQKPSAGYRIEFEPEQAVNEFGSLKLGVRFTSPAGDVAATMMTSPCLIFAVIRQGLHEIVAGETGLVYRF